MRVHELSIAGRQAGWGTKCILWVHLYRTNYIIISSQLTTQAIRTDLYTCMYVYRYVKILGHLQRTNKFQTEQHCQERICVRLLVLLMD